jgi:glycosyltransferase involved in cell wall biosynthesis
MNIVFVTPDLEENSLGRAYCLWLLARACGWTARIYSLRGARVWRPLADDAEFVASCHSCGSTKEIEIAARTADLIISVKPLPESLFPAVACAEALGIPWAVDIDDPDLEGRLRWLPIHRRLAKELLKPRLVESFRKCRRLVRHANRIVSNPQLGIRYPGTVIPHVRRDPGAGAAHRSTEPLVAFVGTPRLHKGLPLLREAVTRLSPQGFKLLVTAPAPPDARPWEAWVGTTSLEEGLELVRDADIVALPSESDVWSLGQLPVKLVDAMLLGRALIVSNVEPMPWAVGNGGLVIEAGSLSQLMNALEHFKSPATRAAAGHEARERALRLFTVESQADTFAAACIQAMHRCGNV